LFAMQEDNGFVGHMTFWKKLIPTHYSDVLQARPTLLNLRPHMSALIQPPLWRWPSKEFTVLRMTIGSCGRCCRS
jgi:hypothetical protein